jgi:hypothetical protein
MSSFTTWGPGTFTIKVGAATEVDYSDECLSFTVGHVYTEVGSTRTTLAGNLRRAKSRRDPDTVTIGLEVDLTATGLYALLQTNDLATATLAYTPSTADEATWSGDVELRLPESVEGAEYGAPITASLTLNALTELTFTPQTVTP